MRCFCSEELVTAGLTRLESLFCMRRRQIERFANSAATAAVAGEKACRVFIFV
jgi:hypothetical protein